ncbi:MAG: hypothetical protein H8Z69_04715 [Nanohaloarchaea archaeon]|nr:hypothetical protein [Candidatus Nanohaloarchaea archaeon]
MEMITKSCAEEIIEVSNIESRVTETHFLFGRNDVFSFEEDGSVFTLIETDETNFLIHDFVSQGKEERKISEVDREDAVEFLENTGHKPFMRLDIERFEIDNGDESFTVEKVEQLGYFSGKDSDSKRNYGELLKDKMIKDKEKNEEVHRGAKKVLNLS